MSGYRDLTREPVPALIRRIAIAASISMISVGLGFFVITFFVSRFGKEAVAAPIIVFYILVSVAGCGLLGIWWGIFAITWTAALVTFFCSRSILKKAERKGAFTQDPNGMIIIAFPPSPEPSIV